MLQENIPEEYVVAGLSTRYVVLYGLADAIWSYVSFAVGYSFPMGAKMLMQDNKKQSQEPNAFKSEKTKDKRKNQKKNRGFFF